MAETILIKKGPVWHFDFTIDGDRYQGSTGSRLEAEARVFVKEMEEAVRRQKAADATATEHGGTEHPGGSSHGVVTIGEVAEPASILKAHERSEADSLERGRQVDALEPLRAR